MEPLHKTTLQRSEKNGVYSRVVQLNRSEGHSDWKPTAQGFQMQQLLSVQNFNLQYKVLFYFRLTLGWAELSSHGPDVTLKPSVEPPWSTVTIDHVFKNIWLRFTDFIFFPSLLKIMWHLLRSLLKDKQYVLIILFSLLRMWPCSGAWSSSGQNTIEEFLCEYEVFIDTMLLSIRICREVISVLWSGGKKWLITNCS